MTALRVAVLLLCLRPSFVSAAEVIPPKPAGYFNDYANVVPRDAALQFNEQLAQFERETLNQVVVAVYPSMQTDSDIADYTQRVAQSWGVGQEAKRNGAVLFVFIQDRKMFTQVGYGLEGVLPDATSFDINERHIKPLFKANDYTGGLATGIDLMMKAIRGEYKGDGKTNLEKKGNGNSGLGVLPILFIILFIYLATRRSRRRGWGYSGGGGPFIGGWGGGGGGWGGGSSGGGGFSGFSGGGGSFGGGGSGSSW